MPTILILRLGESDLSRGIVQINSKLINNYQELNIESFEKPQIQNSQRRTLMRFPSEIGGYSKSSINKKGVILSV